MLMAAAPARAEDVGDKIIRRCTHGKSLTGFSPSAYAKALKELPPDVEEYSDCANLIRRAQAAAASGGGGAPAGAALTGAIPASPAEQQALATAAQPGAAPVEVGGQQVHPGVVHANIASALSSLPTPLLVLLAFLLACVVAFAGGAARKRVRADRPG